MAIHILHIYIPREDILDQAIWYANKNGQYTIKSGYFLALGIEQGLVRQQGHDENWHWKKLWKLQIPPK